MAISSEIYTRHLSVQKIDLLYFIQVRKYSPFPLILFFINVGTQDPRL